MIYFSPDYDSINVRTSYGYERDSLIKSINLINKNIFLMVQLKVLDVHPNEVIKHATKS